MGDGLDLQLAAELATATIIGLASARPLAV
jgi:hypothetical protein